ncbi:Uncharacterised protein [Vibrio cholerae]|nr:Uncharacterised protein [Vibrio cholerae]CSC91338.1 Uncharacterised protein [Vibrio cholerae]
MVVEQVVLKVVSNTLLSRSSAAKRLTRASILASSKLVSSVSKRACRCLICDRRISISVTACSLSSFCD